MRKVREIHGLKNHLIYKLYGYIRQRCHNPNNPSYHRYGGRGITMCDEWIKSFMSFYNWCIENGWQPGLEIDRKENDLGYSPDNCRFVTDKVNANNRHNTTLLFFNDQTKSINDWCDELGLSQVAIKSRYHRGAYDSIEDLLSPDKRKSGPR